MSQRAEILKALKAGKKVSPLSALRDFNCMRLAARIYELRCKGYRIDTLDRHQNGKTYAVYVLRKKK